MNPSVRLTLAGVGAVVALACLSLLAFIAGTLTARAPAAAPAPAPVVVALPAPVLPAPIAPLPAPRVVPAPVAPVAPEGPVQVIPTPAPVAPVVPDPPLPAPADGKGARAFDDGQWRVGTEVAPGTYRSAGPSDRPIKMCYVDAKMGDEIVRQELSSAGPVRITLNDGQTVKASGCQRFDRVEG